MTRRRLRGPVPTFALLVLLALPAAAETPVHPMLGQLAPTFDLEALDGGRVALEDLRGRFVVLHFATSWCPFCGAEAPYLEQLWKDYRARGVEVLTIDIQEPRDVAAKFVERFSLTFPVLLDDGTVSSAYAPEGVLPDLPRDQVVIASNLILDRAGKIRFFSLLDTAAFDARLTKLEQKLDELLGAEAASGAPTP